MIIRAITENTNKDGSKIFVLSLIKSKRSTSADDLKIFVNFADLAVFLEGAKIK